MKKAVIILPTYNEKENIERIIDILEKEVFPKITDWKMEILVADDHSPDGTEYEVQKLMKRYKNLDINQGPKMGLGAAYVRGMTYAIDHMHADVVFEMDADLQHDPKKVPQFLKKIDEGYDMVIGTRYSGGGSIPASWPPQRKAFSIVANLFVRTILMRFTIHDWTGGYRALRKEVFLKEKDKLINFKGYIFQISFLYNAVQEGFRIAEVPFHFSARTEGSSKIASFSYILEVIRYVLIARFHELERFIKFLVVGGTGFIVQLIAQEGSVATGIALTLGLGLQSVFPQANTSALRDGVAASIGAETAILSNFFFNNFWTFQDTKHIKQSSNFFLRLIKFNITSLAAIFVQFAAVAITVYFFGETFYFGNFHIAMRILVLFPVIIFIVIPLNYLIYNKIIWKTQYLKKNNGTNK